MIDVLSVLATVFGLATSLGLGVGQAAAGLNYLFGWPATTGFQVALIAGITGLATLSVVAGLHAGVKRLSQLNVYLAAALLLFVLVAGPTLFILSTFSQSLGYYVQVLPELAWWTEAFIETDWQGGWTIFYWGWWISWSPFVGMFIARISKGRSVREMIIGVVAVPSLLSFLWMSVFGGTALNLQLGGVKDLAGAVENDMATGMFAMLESFPLSGAASLLGVLLVVSFFVTSSDSGSLVVDHLTAGGKLDSPRAPEGVLGGHGRRRRRGAAPGRRAVGASDCVGRHRPSVRVGAARHVLQRASRLPPGARPARRPLRPGAVSRPPPRTHEAPRAYGEAAPGGAGRAPRGRSPSGVAAVVPLALHPETDTRGGAG